MNFKSEKSMINGIETIKLSLEGKETFIEVDPLHGANLLRYCFEGTNIIDCNEEIAAKGGFTGCPILYPTPNRVKDCKTIYNGKEYTQLRDGTPHMLHGYAFFREFTVEEIKIEDTFASVTLSFRMDEDPEAFKSYPFENKLSVTYTLYENSLKFTYKASNLSDSVMPYGFAIHPYFYFKEDAFFTIPSDEFVETTSAVIPTRNILKTEEHFEGINKGWFASNCVLDNNYIKRDGENATLTLTEEKLKVTFAVPDDFKHFVVYHQKGGKFICIENQTCSIDANNMHLEGLSEVANQKFINPGESDSASIELIVERV